MKKILSLVIVFICLLSGCSCNEDEIVRTSILSSYVEAYYSKSSDTSIKVAPFGTDYMTLVGYNERKVKAIEDKYNAIVTKYHSLLDRNYYYKDNEGNFINNIKVINDSYGSGSSVIVDEIIIDILKEGIKYSKLSNGNFNIFSGSIVDVWDERFDAYSLKYGVDPTSAEINEAMKCVVKVSDIDNVFIIDEENNTVTFNKFNGCESGASITLGAMAKSYFIDKLVELDEFKNIGPAIYSAGQSSIILKGDNPTRENGVWSIAVNDSLNSNIFGTVQAVSLILEGNHALSTSGGEYKGYVNSDGVRRHHIINAVSGYPMKFLVGATVVGDNAMAMDVVTTTLMTMSNLDEIKAYLRLIENSGVQLDVLLQSEENNELKIYVNNTMKDKVKKAYETLVIEEFDYGA